MTKFYEVEIVETYAVRRRHLVVAKSVSEALDEAEKGHAVLTTDIDGNLPVVTLAARGAKEVDGEPVRVSLEQLDCGLAKPHAFTVHARTWGEHGMSDPREMAVLKVQLTGERGFTANAFPDGVEEIFVREDELASLTIETESGETTYRVDDIRYDTDGETAIVDLPETLEFDIDAELEGDALQEALGDAISERTGWCVHGFTFEKLADGWWSQGSDLRKIHA